MQRSYVQLTFNNIPKFVRLAQLVEQWTGISEVVGSSPPFNFQMLKEFVLISFIKPNVRKTLNINISVTS